MNIALLVMSRVEFGVIDSEFWELPAALLLTASTRVLAALLVPIVSVPVPVIPAMATVEPFC